MGKTYRERWPKPWPEDPPCWRYRTRYPTRLRGAWPKIKYWRKFAEGSARMKVRDALQKGEEPPPTRHRHSARWEVW